MNFTPRRLCRVLPLCAVLGASIVLPMQLIAQQAAPAAVKPSVSTAKNTTEWFSIDLLGQRAGWCSQSEKRSGESITSDAEMEFSMGRGETMLKVRMSTHFVESPDGKPVSMSLRREMAAEPVTEDYAFNGETVAVTTITRGADGKVVRSTATRPAPKEAWLTPARAAAVSKEKMKAGEKAFSITSIDPTSGLEIVTIERTQSAAETLTIGGKPVKTTVWKLVTKTSSGIDIASTEYVDEQQELVRSITALGGLSMTMTRADASVRGQKATPPEVMVELFVTPDRAIERPRSTTSATYALAVKEGEISPLPTTGAQTFTKIDAHSGTLVISTRTLNKAAEADRSNPAFLENSSMITKDDAKVKGLLADAYKSGRPATAAERAETLRSFVNNYITHKDLGKGFAGAAEVAQSRTGDCTEHGVLLAALLRADGIPARVVSGLIYADQFAGKRNIFGYHMWAQALLEIDGAQRWVDLDGTLLHPFDATHIAVSATALSDGELNNSMMNLVPLLGRLEIKVEKAE